MKAIAELMEKYKKPMERMFYVFLVFVLLYDRLAATPFMPWLRYQAGVAMGDMDPALVDLLFNSVFNLRFLIVIPAVYTLLFEVKNRRQQILMTALLLLGWFYAFYWRERNDTVVFEALILMVACCGREFKKIARTGMGLSILVLILVFLMSGAGIWPDYIDERNGFSRHAFGTFHCTDLAAQWGYMIFLYVFLKDGLLKWYDYLGILFLTVLNFALVDGRNTYLCVILLLIGCVLHSVNKKKHVELPKLPGKIWTGILTLSFVIMAAVYFILNATYTDSPDVFYNRFGVFGSLAFRLKVTANVTRVLPFSWFGKYFLQMGAGFGVNAQHTGMYTFLDCSYMRVYVMYGVVAFVLFLLIFTGIQWRLKKEKQFFRMFILAVVALHCFMEHRWIDMAYDLFLLVAFSDLGEKETIAQENGKREDGTESKD
ncbi:MAG: hypothetical protein K6B69_12545 [Lachnospiraceae bacterium]|nr:hypothetical protein [Lachnospiraceae bacterium]